jgi:predicted permease
VIILLGAVARRFGIIRRSDGPLLVRVVIYLALPALIVLVLIGADLDGALILVPIAGFAIHGILLGLSWCATRVWGMERPRAGALIVATAVGNTGFFGLPLIVASGDGFSLPAAVMYDTLATGIITWTSTVAVSTAYGRADHEPRVPLGDLGRALLLPPNWALALGLSLNLAGVEELPELIDRPLELLAGAVLPLTMIYAGLMIDLRGLPRLWGEVSYATVVRLGIATLVGLGVATALGLTGDILNTVVIMAAMPTAMMSLVIGARSGLRGDVLAAAVVVTTLLSTATLPAWQALLL